ncbi:MAG TPA: tetratricopeptide repeat protein [Longimicrobium sp.]|jgi:tetratricopeptide (TPR) repeat protein
MTFPVFLSYSRSTGRQKAQAVYQALGGAEAGLAFLDESNVEAGESFPASTVDAILGARVVVIFAEPAYFTRWYCLLEYRTALTPFLYSLTASGLTSSERGAMLNPVVLALPREGSAPEFDRFPSLAQATNWPTIDDAEAVAALVRSRLARSETVLREMLEAVHASALETELREAVRLPAPTSASAVRLVPARIPPSIHSSLVGRGDDLWRIDTLLWTGPGGRSSHGSAVVALEGAGGIGKTRLALEYLWRFGPRRFPGGLFWIDADVDPAALEERHYEILVALNPDAPSLNAYRESSRPRSIVRDLLGAVQALPEDTPVLFVVDGVPEPEPGQLPSPLTRWCPVVGLAPVLATSRSRISLTGRGEITSFLLDTLGESAAVTLLTRDVPHQEVLAAEQWREITGWVGQLPLALELLNAALRLQSVSPTALIQRFRLKNPARALDAEMDALRTEVPPGAVRGVREALALAYERLGEREQEAARLLAWLAPEPVPDELLEKIGADVFSPSTRAALISRSFVAPEKASRVPVFGVMHPLLAEFLRAQTVDPAAEMERIVVALLQVMAPERIREPRDWPLMNLCLPHAEEVFARAGAEWEASSLPEPLLWLGLMIGSLLEEQGFGSRAEAMKRQVVEAARHSLGEEHRTTLLSMASLAYSLWSRGDLAGARTLEERVLESRRLVLGEEHPDTLGSISNLAVTLYAQGDLNGARVLQERVLEARRRVLGDEHPDTLTSMNNLASTLRQQGDLSAARMLQERVLAASSRTLGEDHARALISSSNLAGVLAELGDLSGARQLQEQVLETFIRTRGVESPDTLTAMSNLATTLMGLGDVTGAQRLQEQVLEVRRRVLGEEHPDTLTSMHNLASTLLDLGDVAGAHGLLERVLEVRRRVLGEEHPDTLTSMHNLASVLAAESAFTASQQLQERVVEGFHQLFGDEHPNTLTATNSLASTLFRQGNIGNARHLQEHVFNARRRVLGEDHPDTLTAMANLAYTLWALGNLEDAHDLQTRALEAQRQLLGKEHPSTIASLSNLAKITWAQGDLHNALELQTEVLDLSQRVLGQEHPDTLAALESLKNMEDG